MSIIDVLCTQVFDELDKGTLIFPRIPELVRVVDNALSDDSDCSTDDLIHAVSHDAVISARVICAANSTSSQSGGPEVMNCIDAVHSMGLEAVRNVIVAETMKQKFVSTDVIGTRLLQERWKHSVEVGSIAALMCSKYWHLQADTAMMCGILHDIGVIPVVEYLTRNKRNNIFGNDIAKYEVMLMVAEETHIQVGERIARKWNLPEEITSVIKFHHYHGKRTGPRAQYSDIIAICDAYDSHNEGCISKETFDSFDVVKQMDTNSDSIGQFIKNHFDNANLNQMYH